MPYRLAAGSGGSLELLLVTSSNGRWIIPKGDVEEGMAPHLAAEIEAFEEGGVRGRIASRRIGVFRTCKQQNGASIPVDVEAFPLEVTEELDRWPEMGQRRRRWCSRSTAGDLVREPELQSIIRSFSPW